MSVRNKSRRRLAILLLTAVMGVTALGGAYGGMKLWKRHKAWNAREEGLAAFAAGDKRLALTKLGEHLGRYPANKADEKSIEALTKYSLAREEIEEGNGISHLVGALDGWRNLASADPDNPEARRKILEHYPIMGERLLAEAKDAAEALLAKDPNDRQALLERARINIRQRKLDDVRKDVTALLALDPLDLDAQFLQLSLMQESNQSPQDMLAYVAALTQPAPEGRGVSASDPRYALLQARVHTFAVNTKSDVREDPHYRAASAAVTAASKAPVADVKWLRRVVDQFDTLLLFPQALELCRRAAAEHPADLPIQRTLTDRLFLTGDYDAVCGRLESLKAQDNAANGELLGFKAWALLHRSNPAPEHLAEAKAIVAALIARGSSDRRGFALASGLRAAWPDRLADDKSPVTDPVADARQAFASAPGSPFLRYLLAQALSAAGDSQGAQEQYKELTGAAGFRAWAQPHFAYARLLFKGALAEPYPTPLAQDATSHANDGLLRSPAHQEGEVLRVVAGALAVTKAEDAARLSGRPAHPDTNKARSALLEDCTRLEKSSSLQELWATRADLLARLGRTDEALTFVRQKLKESPSRDTLLALAATSSRLKLGLEEECYAACEKAHGISPELAGARATTFLVTNRGPEGLEYIKAVTQGKTDARWRILHARYLDALNDPAARAMWIDLGAAFPTDLTVQRAVLGSRAVAADHKLQADVFERVKKVPDPGTDLEFAYARWLFAEWRRVNSDKPTSDEHLVEAAKILTALARTPSAGAQVRLALAECMQNLKNTAGAAEQLRMVISQYNQLPAAVLQLAELELGRSNVPEARLQLERLVPMPPPDDLKSRVQTLSEPDRLRLINLLQRVGDIRRATLVAEAAGDSPAGALELAQNYAAAGDTNKANATLERLLQSPTLPVLQFAIGYYSATGRTAQVDAALARLETVDAPPGARELLRAEFYASRGEVDKALEQFLAAARAPVPADAPRRSVVAAKASAWRNLLAMAYSAGRGQDFENYLKEGRAAVPEDEGLAAIEKSLPALRTMPPFHPVGRTIISLLRVREEPDSLPACLELLRDIAANDQKQRTVPDSADQARTDGKSQAALVQRLNSLADQNDKTFSLQRLAVEVATSEGRHEDALRLATRATQNFPSAAAAWEVAFRAQFAAGRYEEALRTAQEWRNRNLLRPLDADVGYVAACLSLGRPDAALQHFQADHLQQALKSFESATTTVNADVLLLYCRAHLMKNQPAAAQAVLDPLLPKSAGARRLCLDLTPAIRDHQVAAAWIDRAAAAMPADSLLEKGRVATAWFDLAQRANNREYTARSLAVADALISSENLDPRLLSLAGMLYETSDRLPDAEKAYRRLIPMQPKSADDAVAIAHGLNNLAMMLSKRPEGVSEALELQGRAINLKPLDPNLFDSYALICGAAGRYDRGLAAIEKAIALQGRNPEWRATKLWLLSQSGNKDALKAEHALLTTADRARLSPDAKKRLESIQIQ